MVGVLVPRKVIRYSRLSSKVVPYAAKVGDAENETKSVVKSNKKDEG